MLRLFFLSVFRSFILANRFVKMQVMCVLTQNVSPRIRNLELQKTLEMKICQ